MWEIRRTHLPFLPSLPSILSLWHKEEMGEEGREDKINGMGRIQGREWTVQWQKGGFMEGTGEIKRREMGVGRDGSVIERM